MLVVFLNISCSEEGGPDIILSDNELSADFLKNYCPKEVRSLELFNNSIKN